MRTLMLLSVVLLLASCSKTQTEKGYRVHMLHAKDVTFTVTSMENIKNEKSDLADYYAKGDTVYIDYSYYTVSNGIAANQVVIIKRLY